MRCTRYVQNEIRAIQAKSLALRMRAKNEWLIPNIEGSTVSIIPNMKTGFERTR